MNENLKWAIYSRKDSSNNCDNFEIKLASFSWQTGCSIEVQESNGNTRYKWKRLWGKRFWGCTIKTSEQSRKKSNHLQKESEAEKRRRVGQTPAKKSLEMDFSKYSEFSVNVSWKRSFKISFSVECHLFEFEKGNQVIIVFIRCQAFLLIFPEYLKIEWTLADS